MATPNVCVSCPLACKVLLSSNKAFFYEMLKSAMFSWRIRDYLTRITRKMLLSFKVHSEIEYPLLELLSDYYTIEGNIAFALHILLISFYDQSYSITATILVYYHFLLCPTSFFQGGVPILSFSCLQPAGNNVGYWIRSPAVLHCNFPFSGTWH